MNTKEKITTYSQFMETNGDELIECLKGIAFTADVLSIVKEKKVADAFARTMTHNAVNSWFDLKNGSVRGDDYIHTIDSDSLNAFIKNVFAFSFVDEIFVFCNNKRYELWIIVDENSKENCYKIYSAALECDNTDVLIVDQGQIDYSEMPSYTLRIAAPHKE